MPTRDACHFIAQNRDPGKEEIAFARSYFVVQTRKREIVEGHILLPERLKAETIPFGVITEEADVRQMPIFHVFTTYAVIPVPGIVTFRSRATPRSATVRECDGPEQEHRRCDLRLPGRATVRRTGVRAPKVRRTIVPSGTEFEKPSGFERRLRV